MQNLSKKPIFFDTRKKIVLIDQSKIVIIYVIKGKARQKLRTSNSSVNQSPSLKSVIPITK